MSEPANQRDRDKSSSYTSEQLAYWLRAAREYEDEIDALSGRVRGPILTAWEGDNTCVN